MFPCRKTRPSRQASSLEVSEVEKSLSLVQMPLRSQGSFWICLRATARWSRYNLVLVEGRTKIRVQNSSPAHCTWCWRSFPGTRHRRFRSVGLSLTHLLQGKGHMATKCLQMSRSGCSIAKTGRLPLGLLATSWGDHTQPPKPHSSHVLDGCGDSQWIPSMRSWQRENHLESSWRNLVLTNL